MRRRAAIVAAVATAVAVASAGTAGAVTTKPLPPANQVVSVSPVVVQRTLAAGSRATVVLEVANQTKQPWSFATGVQDAVAASGAGPGVRFVDGDPHGGDKQWLVPASATIHVAPGGVAQVPVTIAVPAGAAPGGHYASVFVQTLPRAGSVRIASRVSVLFLLTVAGDVRHDLQVRVLPTGRVWLRSGRVGWTVDVRNRGNVHELFGGELRVESLFGQRVARPLRPMVVLPGAHRVARVEVDTRGAPDLLRATLHWDRASTRTPARTTRLTHGGAEVVAPWWSLLVAVGALALVAWRLRRRRA